MKRNDTLIKINLLGTEFNAPLPKSQADRDKASHAKIPQLVTTIVRKLAAQVRKKSV